MTTFILVLLAAIAFEYINGFHDAANAIATVVSTKVMTPRQAILMAALTNLLGAFMGVAVAKTISSGYIDSHTTEGAAFAVSQYAVLAALLAGIVWNLVTWAGGIPSSSSHALIGGLCGAVLAQARGDWGVLIWNQKVTKQVTDAAGVVHENVSYIGLWPKLVKPMLVSPMLGFALGWLIMFILTALIVRLAMRPSFVQKWGGRMQVVSAAFMGFSHGSNDAQKTMGIMTLALAAAAASGTFHDLPAYLTHMDMPQFITAIEWPAWFHIKDNHIAPSLPLLSEPAKDAKGQFTPPLWVVLVCAATMAAGTAAGGWRIIKTMGHKMVKLQPVHGFAAETSAAAIIEGASALGIPLSTTHVISTSIMGVGAMKRFSAVKWGVVQRIIWAWVLTLPVTITLGYLIFRAFAMAHLAK